MIWPGLALPIIIVTITVLVVPILTVLMGPRPVNSLYQISRSMPLVIGRVTLIVLFIRQHWVVSNLLLLFLDCRWLSVMVIIGPSVLLQAGPWSLISSVPLSSPMLHYTKLSRVQDAPIYSPSMLHRHVQAVLHQHSITILRQILLL